MRAETPGQLYHFPERTENVQAYGVPGHRHTAEMEQGVVEPPAQRGGGDVAVSFVPHLVPISRGILSTINVPLTQAMSTENVLHVMRGFYRSEPFVRVLDADRMPQTKTVTGSNYCDVTARVDERTGRGHCLVRHRQLGQGRGRPSRAKHEHYVRIGRNRRLEGPGIVSLMDEAE